MKRRREQKVTIYAKSGAWYVRYSDFRVVDGKLERKRLSHQLGSTTEMTKRKAREEAQRFLSSINRPVLQPETAVTLVAFVEKGYFPHIEKRLRPSTLRSYRVEWDAQLKPYCADLGPATPGPVTFSQSSTPWPRPIASTSALSSESRASSLECSGSQSSKAITPALTPSGKHLSR